MCFIIDILNITTTKLKLIIFRRIKNYITYIVYLMKVLNEKKLYCVNVI